MHVLIPHVNIEKKSIISISTSILNGFMYLLVFFAKITFRILLIANENDIIRIYIAFYMSSAVVFIVKAISVFVI